MGTGRTPPRPRWRVASKSKAGARRKPSRSYIATAAVMNSAVCRQSTGAPPARARSRQALTSACPIPWPRAAGSTPRARNPAHPAGHPNPSWPASA
jgi:hypothetical protein